MTKIPIRLVTFLAPALILAVAVLTRADEPAKRQDHLTDTREKYEALRKQMREKGLLICDEDEKAVQRLQSTIEKEIDSPGNHPWAGRYYLGDGLDNSYVYVAPRAGFLFIHRGDIGIPYANHARVEQKDDRLSLSFSHPLTDDRVYGGLSESIVPVAWGERRYLIPAEELIDFCNQVNAGREPREDVEGFCLLRRGDEKKKVTGFPAVPAEFTKYLLAKPIEADIIAIEKPVTTPGHVTKVVIGVTLNRGKNAGLLPGMELHVVDPTNVSEYITIKSVDEERSEGVLTQYRPSGVLSLLSYLFDATPKVGWKLSTRSDLMDRVQESCIVSGIPGHHRKTAFRGERLSNIMTMD